MQLAGDIFSFFPSENVQWESFAGLNCKTDRFSSIFKNILDSVGEGEDGMIWENSIETSILSRVKQITSPGGMHVLRPGALGRPRGIRWRGRREWGSWWGTHANPWLIHVSVWQKPLQCCKVISLQLLKINGKKTLKNKNKNIFQWL